MILKSIDRFTDFIGSLSGFLMILMMINVFADVIARYFFNTGSVASQEMQWHLFSVMFLLGISYALKEEAHVRVDFLYDAFKPKTKAYINIIGTILFLIPFALLITYGSYEFVLDAYSSNEISQDPGGLTHRWVIKAMIPLSFIFLIISAIGYILKNIQIIKDNR